MLVFFFFFGPIIMRFSVVFFSVSVAELQTHTELDTDADGALSDSEAQVLYICLCLLSALCVHLLFIPTAVRFLSPRGC